MPATVLVSHPCFLVAAGLISMLARVPGWRVHAQPASRSLARDAQAWRGVDAIVTDSGWGMSASATEDLSARGLVVIAPRQGCVSEVAARLLLHCDERELIEAVTHAIAGDGAAIPERADPRPLCRGGLAPSALRRVRDHIDGHLGHKIEMRDLADYAGVSVCHFSRAFRQSVGESPHRYVVMRRIEVAMARVCDNDVPLGEIGIATGFSDQSHFTRVFRAVTGETPYAFRRRHR
ncbi:MAG: AraC family transcriptional regulator [Burkholderiales bacterium]